MSIPFLKASRLSAPLVAALVLLAGCGDSPTAPDPLDAELLATRLEALARRAPRVEGVLLGAAGVHFRDAGRVTPIAVVVGGRTETWFAATSEMVFPAMPCLSPVAGISCPGIEPLALRHLVAVDGVNATRLLIISSSTAGTGSFDREDFEWPALPATGILLVRGSGVQAFATSGSVTSSLTETLGACPEAPRRGPAAPPIESCERVSISWQADAEMTSSRAGEAAPTMRIVLPSVEVSGARLVMGPLTFPGR